MSTIDDLKRFDDEEPKKVTSPVQNTTPMGNTTQPTATGTSTDTQASTTPQVGDISNETKNLGEAIANRDTKGIAKSLVTEKPQEPAAPGVSVAEKYLRTHDVDMNEKVPEQEEKKAPPTSNAEILKILEDEIQRNKQASEQDENEMKRMRRNEKLAAISDGIAALANMWATHRGAINAYDPKNSLYGKVHDRYEKVKGDRDANRQAYIKAALNKYNIQKGKEDADIARTNAADKAELSWYKLLYDRDYKNKMLGLKGEANKNAADKIKGDQDYHTKSLQLQGERNANQARHNRAMEGIAAAKEARLAYSDTGGGGNGKSGKYTVTLRDGSTHTYKASQMGAINSLAPEMIRRARAAAERYNDAGDFDTADHYSTLAERLEKTGSKDGINSLIVANIKDFPGMQDGIRRILGIGGVRKVAKKQTTKQQSSSKSTTGYGGITYGK